MMTRILTVAVAAAALTFAGCNKSDDNAADTAATDSTELTTGTAEEATLAPDNADAESLAEETAAAQAATAAQTAVPAASTPAPADAQAPAAPGGEVTLPGGTQYVDVVVGTGEVATPGKIVSVHYTGTLTDGTKFDSSLDRGRPFEFRLGEGRVIQGWEEGIAGMKVGGKRKLTIPPAAGYGSEQKGPIPPNSTLLFDVELLDVK